jgi:hypothetical protein
MAFEDLATIPVMFFQAAQYGNIVFAERLIRPTDVSALLPQGAPLFPEVFDPAITRPGFPLSANYGMIPAGTPLPRYADPTQTWEAPADLILQSLEADLRVPGASNFPDTGGILVKRTLTYGESPLSTLPAYPAYHHLSHDFSVSRARGFDPDAPYLMHIFWTTPGASVDPIGWEKFTTWWENGAGAYKHECTIETDYLWWWDGAELGADHLIRKGVAGIDNIHWETPNSPCGIGLGGAVYPGRYTVYDTPSGDLTTAYCDVRSLTVHAHVTRKTAAACSLLPALLPLGLGAFLALALWDSGQGLPGRRRQRKLTYE